MKGNHSGRPLRNPIKNCVAVYSDIPYLFEVVYLLFKGKKFNIHIGGSVVPFIKIEFVKQVMNEGIEKYNPSKLKLLEQVNSIDKLVTVTEEKIKLFQMMQIAICQEFLK